MDITRHGSSQTRHNLTAKCAEIKYIKLSPMVAIAIVTFIFVINLLGVKLAAQIQGI
jgi:amino acid transporter